MFSKKARPLNHWIILQPVLIFLALIIAIFVSFNQLSHRFLITESQDALQSKIDVLNKEYVGEVSDYQNQTLFQAEYLIINEKKTVVYSSTTKDKSIYDENSSPLLQTYLKKYGKNSYFSESYKSNHALKELSHAQFLRVNQKTYAIKIQKMTGLLSSGTIKQSSENSKTYYVLYSLNVTSLSRLITTINDMFIVLSLVFIMFALIFIAIKTRQVSKRFSILEESILSDDLSDYDNFKSYGVKEFDRINESVYHLKMENQQQSKAKELFYQNISHELRTPLMSIQGYAEGIMEGIFDDNTFAARIINEESQKMSNLIDAILMVSKVHDMDDSRFGDKIGLKTVFKEIDLAFSPYFIKKEIRFTYDNSSKIRFIKGNKEFFTQAISNIVKNALRYAKHEISFSVFEENNKLVISLTNDGELISEEDEKSIFDRFYKGENGEFGIGLSLTQEIIRKHNGQIRLERLPKTSFQIYLPK